MVKSWEHRTRFALIPALFTHRFDRALVIGLGTGNTLRAVAQMPFQKIDAAELAPQVVEAALLWFADVNGRVFDRDPRVTPLSPMDETSCVCLAIAMT